MKPILAELAKEQKGKMIFLDLEINDYGDVAKQFEITLIPTIIYYDKHGKPKGRTVGFSSKEQLLAQVKTLGLNK